MLRHTVAMLEPEQPIEIVREQAYAQATTMRKEAAIDPEEFRDLYGDAALKFDADYVEEHEQKFLNEETPQSREDKKLATIFEGVWQDMASKGWLGKDAEAITPTRYDDIKNGIDSIVEFRKGPRAAAHLALGIDVTFSTRLGHKLERATFELKKNKLAEVKYFHSEHMGIKKRLKDVPRVVIGLERAQVDRLAKSWIGNAETLKDDPMQVVLLDEIKMQLGAFKKYAERIGQKGVLPHYEAMEKIVDGLLAEKSDLRASKGAEIDEIKKRDRVYRALEDFLKYLNP